MIKTPGKMDQPVVRVENLGLAYETRKGDVHAVRDVSFELFRGETLGIVGESGCGKSTVAYGLVNYMGKNGKIVKGDIVFQGQSLVGRSPEELRKLRGDQNDRRLGRSSIDTTGHQVVLVAFGFRA